ncbi:unnamed protein product [Cylindrotheca closterium]|uniref:SLC41A/MgtE integral membrane domain-containing protein n=1 Tax=Cylindrotheca closterium TaxID=2856 RepID=A0AAD2FIG1_9STRA|nr:unnamed protein product [Cylindrotheca closterium]
MDSQSHTYEKEESDGNELEVIPQHENSDESKVEADRNSDVQSLERLVNRSENSLDDDNWSQQVETDETVHMAPSVVMEEMEGSPHHVPSIADNNSDDLTSDRRLLSASNGLAPKREEPTLKEKLVERERQRRVETERARLKRHFALSSNDAGAPSVESGEPDGSVPRENGSIAATIGGGSSVAFFDPNDEEGQRLTYPMERFLQDQGVIEEESTRDVARDGGVLMERFLMEPVVVVDSPSVSREDNQHIDGSASFEVEPHSQEETVGAVRVPPEEPVIDRTPSDPVEGMGVGEQTASSADGAALPDTEQISFPASPSMDHSFGYDEPRVLRLTEAEIQEMAAIDEMSRSNAPPSDRGDISESSFVGELMSDFATPQIENMGWVSQGTGATEMESASADHSRSERTMSEHDGSPTINIPGTASVSSNAVSSTDASVAANPPSEIEGDEALLSPIQSRLESLDNPIGSEEDASHGDDSLAPMPVDDPGPPDLLQEPGQAEMRIVNRQIRPGMVPRNRGAIASPLRRSISAPDNLSFDVSGFDYDKEEVSPESPIVNQEDVLPSDMWSPGSNMSWSPSLKRSVQAATTPVSIPVLPSYSDNNDETEGVKLNPRLSRNQMNAMGTKAQSGPTVPTKVPTFPQMQNGEVDIFDRIRISNSVDSSYQNANRRQYLEGTIVQRAFPERGVILSISLLLEVPILLMICGGSDKLFDILGQSKYQLFVGILPICTAVSGNVALQTSELTVRAIIQGQVNRKSYTSWILKEIGASAYLGLAMSTVVGVLCLFLGGFHLAFVSVMAGAQFLSILLAGLTGSIVPLLATKIFGDEGKSWNSAIVTAAQDLVGSAVMVTMIYKLGESFGPMEENGAESCGVDSF